MGESEDLGAMAEIRRVSNTLGILRPVLDSTGDRLALGPTPGGLGRGNTWPGTASVTRCAWRPFQGSDQGKTIVTARVSADAELVQRAQHGEREAFGKLFERLHQPVLNYVYHMLGERQAAEDVTQEAFLRAQQHLAQLGPPWDFKSWIYRIAGNLAIDLVRGEKPSLDTDQAEDVPEPVTTRRPLERKVQREETRLSVRRTLASLPPPYRQALILREINGLSYDEVARALECSNDNARQLVHRARLRFRELHGLRMVLASGGPRCRQLGDRLSAYHDGELAERERRLVEEHLRTCAECSDTRQDMKKLRALMASLTPVVPSGAWKAKVLEQLARSPMPSAPTPASLTPPPPPSAAGLAGFFGSWAGKAGLALALAVPVLAVGAVVLATRILPIGAATPTLTSGMDTVVPPTAASAAATVTPHPAAGSPTPASPAASASPSSPSTPTLGPPMVLVLQQANCRAGPGLVYDVIGYLHPGDTSPIDGRNAESTWWWVQQVMGWGHCWVSDAVVEVSGDTSGVPILTPPPTPTPPDTRPPSVTVAHSPLGPSHPNSHEPVTFTASAQDDRSVARIEIWILAPASKTFVLARACTEVTTCIYTGGPYPAGTGQYFARAVDASGNQAETPRHDLTIYPFFGRLVGEGRVRG